MWLMFGGFSIWIILGVVYGIAVIFCWVRENAEMKRRQAEREERRRIQNAEWEEQLRTNPTLRLILIMDQRRREQRAEDRETLDALKTLKIKKKPKTNWKEEGF
jgi:hypothetical protein